MEEECKIDYYLLFSGLGLLCFRRDMFGFPFFEADFCLSAVTVTYYIHCKTQHKKKHWTKTLKNKTQQQKELI